MEDEILDIVDDSDKVIGKDTRDNIWKRGLHHNVRVVNIFILNSEGKILLPKRTMTKKIFPGCFDFSCGEHVLSGETYDEAAIRGLKEELDIKELKLETLGKLTPSDGVGCFSTYYKVVFGGEIKNFNKDEVEKLFWFTPKELDEMLKKDESKFKGGYKQAYLKFIKNDKN